MHAAKSGKVTFRGFPIMHLSFKSVNDISHSRILDVSRCGYVWTGVLWNSPKTLFSQTFIYMYFIYFFLNCMQVVELGLCYNTE